MELKPRCYLHPGTEATILCQRCSRPICVECMVEAAVGFQCPQCVSSGHRETRQRTGSYGGIRSRTPQQTSVVIVGLNLVVWLAVVLTGGQRSWVTRMLALTPQGSCRPAFDPGRIQLVSQAVCDSLPGSVWEPGLASGAFWQVLTSAFTHVAIYHIGFNMLALWILGPQIEAVLGRTRFLGLYLGSAVTASTLVVWFSLPYVSTLGASGAIFGLMGAMLVISYRQGGDYRSILVWLAINVAMTFLYSNISWQGHLGGLLGGGAIAAIYAYLPRNRHGLAFIGLMAACIAAMVVRVVALA